jgi:hypothetical protein
MAIQSFSVGQVLTAAQVNALQANDYNQTVSNKTASYTLVAADKGTRIAMSSTSATTITVDTGLFSAGDTLFIQNLNSGVSTITAGTATVTTSASLALAQWEGGTLYFTSTSAAIFIKGAGASAASGGMTLISEQVANANSAIDFTSIPQTYKQLLLMYSGVYHTQAANIFGFKVNNTTATDLYALQTMRYQGTGWSAEGASVSSDDETLGYDVTSTSGHRTAMGHYLIDNYASTTKVKQIYRQVSWFRADVSYKYFEVTNGFINTTTAITQLSIVRTLGTGNITNIANTSIRLYGIS